MTTPNDNAQKVDPMPTNNAKGLEEVLGLLAKMSPGPLECGAGGDMEPDTIVYCDDMAGSAVATCAHDTTVMVSYTQERDNAIGFAAAVNYLRSHGAAIAALPALWRQRAEIVRGMKGGRNYRKPHGTNLVAAHICDCAAELDAALRQVGGK